MDIKLNEKDIKYILSETDFVEEKVTLWYDNSVDPYFDNQELLPVTKWIVYPRGQRPIMLDNEHPMVNDFKTYLLENAIPELFKQIVLYNNRINKV